MLQYVAVCCSMLQCVAVCCRALQCVKVHCSVLKCVAMCVRESACGFCVLQCVAVCCSVVQCVCAGELEGYFRESTTSKRLVCGKRSAQIKVSATHCNALQRAATHCNIFGGKTPAQIKVPATHCNALQHLFRKETCTLQGTAAH